jgi:hypothetical protein
MPCRRSDANPAKKVSTVDPKFTVLAESATDRPCFGPEVANRRVSPSAGVDLEWLKVERLQISFATVAISPRARPVWADV